MFPLNQTEGHWCWPKDQKWWRTALASLDQSTRPTTPSPSLIMTGVWLYKTPCLWKFKDLGPLSISFLLSWMAPFTIKTASLSPLQFLQCSVFGSAGARRTNLLFGNIHPTGGHVHFLAILNSAVRYIHVTYLSICFYTGRREIVESPIILCLTFVRNHWLFPTASFHIPTGSVKRVPISPYPFFFYHCFILAILMGRSGITSWV